MSVSTRRVPLAALALTLAGGGLLLAPSPAQAGVLDTPTSSASVSFNFNPICTTVGPGDALSNTVWAADGATVTTSAASNLTVTHNVDLADITTMSTSISQKITANQANNSLTSIDVQVTGQGSLAVTEGAAQKCNGSVTSTTSNSAEFDLPSAKIVTFDLESKEMVGVLVVQATNAIDGAVEVAHVNSHGTSTQTVYMPAGHYLLAAQSQLQLQAPTPTQSRPSSRTGFVTGHISFQEPGIATTATSGDGTKYVDLASSRNCAAGTLTATFKNKAGKGIHRSIKKATFYVNDVKVGAVKKPKKKSTKVLTGLSSDDAAHVEVRMKLLKKGAGVVTAERSYLSCT